ncbi:MAG: outer membrane protein assembly factor BamC [Oleiphilaceae bacterium]|nr:outer membrane protein assembly factor BamC [Oleiphilaceae bacterium]
MPILNGAAPRTGRFLLVLSLAASMAGCSLFPDRAESYLDEPEGEPLTVPEGADRSRLQSQYPIPETLSVLRVTEERREEGYELPEPPDLTADILEQDYSIEQSGDQVWLLVNDVPGRVWPAVSAFLREQGIELAADNPRTGLKQTRILNDSQRARQWLDLEGGEGETLRVAQFRIAHGVRARSSEVQVRLPAVQERPAPVLPWNPAPRKPALERRILDDMAIYFSDTDDTKAFSRVALNLPRDNPVSREMDNGELEALTLALDFDRAWFEVGRALSAAEIAVVDLDRSLGEWRVDFRDPDDRGRRWLFWKERWEPEYTFLLRLEGQGQDQRLTARRAPDYEGEDRSEELLRTLFNEMQ